jgi:hypothetical protein
MAQSFQYKPRHNFRNRKIQEVLMEGNNGQATGAGLIDKVKQGATAQLSTQKDRATEGIGSVVDAVRQSTRHLRDNQHDTIAEYVDQAAGHLERWSNQLKEKNVGEILQEAQQLARRRPAVFIGAAFAVGLLGARFLKSSRDRQSSNASRSGGANDIYGVRGGDRPRDLATSPSVSSSFDAGRI